MKMNMYFYNEFNYIYCTLISSTGRLFSVFNKCVTRQNRFTHASCWLVSPSAPLISQSLTSLLGKLSSALLSGLSDRSTTVRKNYARAIGHLVKVGSVNAINTICYKCAVSTTIDLVYYG